MALVIIMKSIKGVGIEYVIADEKDTQNIIKTANALTSEIRINFLRQLIDKPMTITELAKLNNLANSTVIFHLNVLEEAQLIKVQNLPSKKGKAQVNFLHFFYINFKLFAEKTNEFLIPTRKLSKYEQSMPVGMYVEAFVTDYIRFASETELIRIDKNEIYDNCRQKAELLWIDGGKISYAFNNAFALEQEIEEIEFSLEICSEINYYRNDWKSDITFAINNVELCTYTSPGDFGGRKGKLNPDWWGSSATQFGLLTIITVNKTGVFLNQNLIDKNITIDDLRLKEDNRILFSIYNKQDAVHYGGFNIFGKKFGNYPQDIVLTAHYYEEE